MDASVTYGNVMEGRSDLLAVVQNLNCIASPGKVLVVPLSSEGTVPSKAGGGSTSVASSDSRSVGSANDELVLEEEHIDLSPVGSDASDDSSNSPCNYDNCSIEKLEFMASLSLLPKPLVKDIQQQNIVIKHHYGNWHERLHSKDFTAIQSEVYGEEFSHSAAELAHFSGYDQSSWQPQNTTSDSRKSIILATVCNQQNQQPVTIEAVSEQQHNSNLLQIAHQLQERHKVLAEAKHQLESEEQLLKQNIQRLASCFTSPQLQ